MKFTVDRDVLASKLTVAMTTIGKATELTNNPSLGGILFEIRTSGKAVLFTTNGKLLTRIYFDVTDVADVPAEGTGLQFLAEGAKLHKLVQTLESGPIKFVVNQKTIRLTQGSENHPFQLMVKKDYPNVLPMLAKAEEKGTLNATALVRALNFLKRSINDQNPQFDFAQYDSGMFRSTNVSALAIYKVPLGETKIKVWGVAISPLLQFIRGLEEVRLFETPNHMLFERDGDLFGYTRVTYEFRAISSKVNPEDTSEPELFTVSKSALLDSLSKLNIMIDAKKDYKVYLTVTGEGDKAVVGGRVHTTTGGDSHVTPVPVDRERTGAEGYDIPVSLRSLMNSLVSIDSEKVQFYVKPNFYVKLVAPISETERAISMVGA